MTCKDYQDDLRIRAENDEAAKKTKQMLEVGHIILQLSSAPITKTGNFQESHSIFFLLST